MKPIYGIVSHFESSPMGPLAALESEKAKLKAENAALRQRAERAEKVAKRLTDIARSHTCNISLAPSECEACCESDDAIREGLGVGR